MSEQNIDSRNNSVVDLKMLSQEELEAKVDLLLAKCRRVVDIKKTSDQGAMFRKGPFQISISLAVKMNKYQDELIYCTRNPYDVLLSVCADNGWGTPEFRAVDYIPGEGFLFSVIINDHELVSKWRNRRLLLAADLASANFLRYLGLWVNVSNLSMYFDWEHCTDEGSAGEQNEDFGDLNGYLYFMGFSCVESETTEAIQSTSKSVYSLRPNMQLQLAKLMFVVLMSRGEKSCWFTDVDIAFFKKRFGSLDTDALYAFNNESWNPQVVCSCGKKQYKICFDHDEYFFYHLLKNYNYVNQFGPVVPTIFENLKEIETEDDKKKTNKKDILTDKEKVFREEGFRNLKYVKKEEQDDVKCCIGAFSKKTEHFNYSRHNALDFKSLSCTENLLTNSKEFDRTEIPVNLRARKFDLRSKIFGTGKVKVEDAAKEEKVGFKISFDNNTGLSNVKSSAGGWISMADISPPQVGLPLARVSGKRLSPPQVGLPLARVSGKRLSPPQVGLPLARVSGKRLSPPQAGLPLSRVSGKRLSPPQVGLPLAGETNKRPRSITVVVTSKCKKKKVK